ncbi:MAG: hypothetical protein KGQ59_09890 [Bdellovibrionales bacterium]|nr:hypothetical protein [Bdellovibrionales bacterium]
MRGPFSRAIALGLVVGALSSPWARLSNSLAGEEKCLEKFAQLIADPVEFAVDRSRGIDFFAIREKMLSKKKALKHTEKWNQDLLEALQAPLAPTGSRRNGVTREEADDLYRYVNCHPVAGMSQVRKYDPAGNFGFCFGRATAVHVEALRRGLSRSRVLKIWGVGPMKGGWGHHVATLVAGKEGGWWAIDPEVGKVVSATEWMKWLKDEQENLEEPLVFFVSEAERFGPASSSKYNRIDLYGTESGDIYNGYFRDLLRGKSR